MEMGYKNGLREWVTGIYRESLRGVTALLQTLVRGSAEPSLGAIYIDISFPRPSSRPRLGILVH